MEHFYKNIQGWFDFQDIYTDAVSNAQDGAHFVELGAWLGCSTAYMAVEIANSGKNIKFDVVDTWKGTPSEIEFYEEALQNNNWDVYDVFLANIKPVITYINPLKMTTTEASRLIPDNSVDFIFVDACHDYDCVKSDLIHWLPKLKQTGCIAGHDWDRPGVNAAVIEILHNVAIQGISWVYNKSLVAK